MTTRQQMLLAPLALTIVGCVANDGKFNVRPIANPLAAAQERGTPMITEGRGLLALGHVGLALEAFRKSLRDEPASNVAALAGIAACYERMGRYDLSRANYEAALALEPTNVVLLNTFAASLEHQGRTAEAAAVRQEAFRRDAAVVTAAAQDVASAAASEIHVELPQTRPARSVELAATPASTPSPMRVRTADKQPVSAPVITKTPAPAASITVALPPARVANPVASISAGEAKRIAVPVRPMVADGPRLERTSLGEVALVTSREPLWRPQLVARTQHSVTVQFVPLRTAYRDTRVRLLNAARHEGLAARTRMSLGRKGWNHVLIGDAGRVREKTLVLYSPATAGAARRLATEFGFGIAKIPRPGPLTVLLGRDAVRRPQAKS